jgi:NAD(P)-dependent dehydrogenase (short-subunit alcohol dehydrogenase family)
MNGLVRSYGDSVLALPLDVADRGPVFKAVNQARQHFGRLDIILSNAGYGLMDAEALEGPRPLTLRTPSDCRSKCGATREELS